MKRHITWVALLTLLIVGPAAPARSADAADGARPVWVMHFDSDWRNDSGLPEKAMLIGLQGLANRDAPRLYIVHADDYP